MGVARSGLWAPALVDLFSTLINLEVLLATKDLKS